jgi:hypothetical protein
MNFKDFSPGLPLCANINRIKLIIFKTKSFKVIF